jgi:hypothetical protein
MRIGLRVIRLDSIRGGLHRERWPITRFLGRRAVAAIPAPTLVGEPDIHDLSALVGGHRVVGVYKFT